MTQAQIRKKPDPAADPSIGEVLSTLKRKEFLTRVKLAAETRKPDLPGIVDATLAVLGEALARGEGVHLRALGRARVNRSRTAGTGATTTLTIKLRRGAGGKAGAAKGVKESLAEAGD